MKEDHWSPSTSFGSLEKVISLPTFDLLRSLFHKVRINFNTSYSLKMLFSCWNEGEHQASHAVLLFAIVQSNDSLTHVFLY